jgi:hypothetical protein
MEEDVPSTKLTGKAAAKLVHHRTGLLVEISEAVSKPDALVDAAVSAVRQLHFYFMFRSQLRSVIATNDHVDLSGQRFGGACDAAIQKFLTSKQYPSYWLSRHRLFSDSVEPTYLYFQWDGQSVAEENAPGIEYERAVRDALSLVGFQAELTSATNDRGVDVLAELDGLRFAVQCKAHGKPIGVKGVQEVVAGMRMHRCDYAAVFSESGFTNAAYELARENQCALLSLGQAQNLARMF